MDWKTCRFEALDTLFFRESRPMESIGGSELGSVFPPPVRTLAGALKASIAEHDPGFTAETFADAENQVLRELIGYGDEPGSLTFQGPWVVHDGERWFPAPLSLVAEEAGTALRYLEQLEPGSPQSCDLGENVCLPALPANWAGEKARSLDYYWISAPYFQQLLAGKLPPPEAFIKKTAFYDDEARLGIARNNRTRTVEDGLLYQTRHLRMRPETAFELDVKGLPDERGFAQRLNRLGGEGRLAQVTLTDRDSVLPGSPENHSGAGILLYLLTPAAMQGSSTVERLFPQSEGGWQPQTRQGGTVWQGRVRGIRLTLHGMVSGRARREGGWDMAQRRPRTVRSYLPAGTVWYCTLDDDNYPQAREALHGQQIGQEQALGRGQLAVGVWPQAPNS